MIKFFVTFEVVTEESAEQGEAAHTGYVTPGQWQYEQDPATGEYPDSDIQSAYGMSLREARNLCDGGLENSGRWFTQSDADIDYTSGEHETRSIHPPQNITRASYARLVRLFNA